MHLVPPRCQVGFVEFLCRKSASHVSIHVELLLLVLCDASCAGCYYNDQLVLRECGLRHVTQHTRMGLDQVTKHFDTM